MERQTAETATAATDNQQTAVAETPAVETANAQPEAAAPATGAEGAVEAKAGEEIAEEVKPYLGAEEPKADAGERADAEQAKTEGGKPKEEPPTEQAYLDAVKKDENILGKNDNLAFDQRLVKSVIPVCQKYGISTEAANAMANAFAKAQLDVARESLKERGERMTSMSNEARAKYSDGDFRQISRGIDRHFKPGGVMNNVIRNSELGADPEFLALMHALGAEEREDIGVGGAEGAGGGTGDPNGIGGMSRLW